MQTTLNDTETTQSEEQQTSCDGTLINLAAHRQMKSERFADVDDLLDRLTYDAVNVANGGCRTS